MTENSESKFDVRFEPAAVKEYEKLSQPVLGLVNDGLDKLVARANEIGKPLGNKRDMKLAGCRELKLQDAGVRIIYRVTNEIVDVLRVVYILTIEKRSADFVFKIASKRYKVLRDMQTVAIQKSQPWEKK